MGYFVQHVLKPQIMRRAVKTAVIVGTLLTLINQGDTLLAGAAPNWVKLCLTYLVPYCVSTHGAVTALRDVLHDRVA